MSILGEFLKNIPWYAWVGIAALIILMIVHSVMSTSPDASGEPDDRWRRDSQRWATPGDVQDLVARNPLVIPVGYVVVGWMGCQPILCERNAPVLVEAPTGGGKSSRVVVPDVLRWNGPAVVASVKGDVYALTKAQREKMGTIFVFDPTGISGHVSCRWSPLMGIVTYDQADRMAATLVDTANVGGLEDSSFWEGQGQNLVGPLLWCAILTRGTMGTVADWLGMADMDQRIERILDSSIDQATSLLNHTSPPRGSQVEWNSAWDASEIFDGSQRARRDYYKFSSSVDRTRSSIVLTASYVMKAWGSAAMAATTDVDAASNRPLLDIDNLLPKDTSGDDGVDKHATLYIVAPQSEQSIYRPVFETLINEILRRVEIKSQLLGGKPITPPLMLCIDEAANVAVLRKLANIASKVRGEGVLLITVWQDESQIISIYGRDEARAIKANHLCQVYFTGRMQDDETLDTVSRMIGTDTVMSTSTSTPAAGSGGTPSTTVSPRQEIVAPVWWLRQKLYDDEAVVLMSGRPPMLLEEPGWFEDDNLRALIPAPVADEFDNAFAPVSIP